MTKSGCTIASLIRRSFSSNEHVFQKKALAVVAQWNTSYRAKPTGEVEVKECHLCSKGNRSNIDNLWKLCVRPNGSYYCFRCSCGGNYAELKTKAAEIGGSLSHSSNSESPKFVEAPTLKVEAPAQEKKSDKIVLPDQYRAFQYHLNLFPPPGVLSKASNSMAQHRDRVKKYLNEVRGLNDDILKKYLVGFGIQQFLNDENKWIDHVCVSFPWIQLSQSVDENSIKFDSGTKPFPIQGKSTNNKPVTILNDDYYVMRMKYR